MDYFIRYLRRDVKLFKVSYDLYGIGRNIMHYVCVTSGVHPYIKACQLNVNSIAYTRITEFFADNQQNYGDPLKRIYKLNLVRLVDAKTYRGSRHKNGYPSRGQRTHTNNKTKKQLFAVFSRTYGSATVRALPAKSKKVIKKK